MGWWKKKKEVKQNWDLESFEINFVVDDELHGLINDMLDTFLSNRAFLDMPICRIQKGIRDRLQDGRLTGQQATQLHEAFVLDFREIGIRPDAILCTHF